MKIKDTINEIQHKGATTDSDLNFVKIDTISFIELCDEINALKSENKFLKEENTHFKGKNLALTKRLQNVTLWDLSEEEQEKAGHLLAKSLLGGK